MRWRRRPGALPFLGGLLACYLAVPLAAFAVRLAASSRRGFGEPGLLPALYVSAACATISLALTSVLGIPLAYVLSRSRSRVAQVVGVVVQLPLALPPVMGGILLVYLVGPYTAIGGTFGGRLTDSMAGVVLAQTFVSAPFLVVAARAAFSSVEPALLDVAATLGHGETSRFVNVALPAAAPGIRAGMLLAWLRAFGEYGATVILAYHPFSLPVYTFNQFSETGLAATQAPTALALAAAAVALAVSRLRPGATFRELRRRSARVAGGVSGGAPATLAPPAAPAPIRFELDHRQGEFHLLVEHLSASGRLAVLGPSGSGKSTLLGCLAGLRGNGAGGVWVGGDSLGELAPERRGIGYLAQGFSLFPHLRVDQQVRFGARARPELAREWLARLRLEGLGERLPRELSGGQRQRVGLVQALACEPRLLLLDEPFSGLDVPVRRELQRELRELQRSSALSTVLVTHDPEEAALLADEVVVLADGRALQAGSVREVYSRPCSARVARLVGMANIARGQVRAPGLLALPGASIPARTGDLEPGSEVLWSIRPEHVRFRSDERQGCLRGRLTDLVDLGTTVELGVEVAPGLSLLARLLDPPPLQVGSACTLELPADSLSLWAAGGAPVRTAPGAPRRRSSP